MDAIRRGSAVLALMMIAGCSRPPAPEAQSAAPPTQPPEAPTAATAAPESPAPVEASGLIDDPSACVPERMPRSEEGRRVGHLDPELIRRTMRTNYEKFRGCYLAGLARNPGASGLVSVRFDIGVEGKVTDAYVVKNELPDCVAVACMLEHFRALSFPAPTDGIVTVVYPIRFAPE
jgi:hypothetical protein